MLATPSDQAEANSAIYRKRPALSTDNTTRHVIHSALATLAFKRFKTCLQ